MAKRRRWSRADVRTLRGLAGRKPVKTIARAVKRSEAAVRFKAFTQRIRLAMK